MNVVESTMNPSKDSDDETGDDQPDDEKEDTKNDLEDSRQGLFIVMNVRTILFTKNVHRRHHIM